MARRPRDKTARQRRRARRRAAAACLLPSAFWFLSGCAFDGGRAPRGNDPLLGGPPIPRPVAAAGAPSASPAQPAGLASTAALPPLTSPRASPSNAVLAAGAVQTLDTPPGLRVPNGTPAGWQGQSSPGVVLSRPEPIPDPPQGPAPAVAPAGGPVPPPAAGPASPTYEQLQSQLTARGVKWQRLEMVAETGQWKFTCIVPNRQNPNVNRTLTATADDDLAALRAVLEQVDR